MVIETPRYTTDALALLFLWQLMFASGQSLTETFPLMPLSNLCRVSILETPPQKIHSIDTANFSRHRHLVPPPHPTFPLDSLSLPLCIPSPSPDSDCHFFTCRRLSARSKYRRAGTQILNRQGCPSDLYVNV